MKKIRVTIFGSGQLSSAYLTSLDERSFVIGVDKAAVWLLRHKIIPDMAIGDFDSVTNSELSLIEKKILNVLKFSPNKNFTDMELAVIEAIKMKPKEVVIYGGIGTRLDHTLSTVQLLEHYRKKDIDMSIVDQKNEISLLYRRRTIILSKTYKYISILPISDSMQVSLTGFLYSTDMLRIKRGQSIGISNELEGISAIIEVHEGMGLLIRSRD